MASSARCRCSLLSCRCSLLRLTLLTLVAVYRPWAQAGYAWRTSATEIRQHFSSASLFLLGADTRCLAMASGRWVGMGASTYFMLDMLYDLQEDSDEADQMRRFNALCFAIAEQRVGASYMHHFAPSDAIIPDELAWWNPRTAARQRAERFWSKVPPKTLAWRAKLGDFVDERDSETEGDVEDESVVEFDGDRSMTRLRLTHDLGEFEGYFPITVSPAAATTLLLPPPLLLPPLLLLN
jgi:hypothetical protein